MRENLFLLPCPTTGFDRCPIPSTCKLSKSHRLVWVRWWSPLQSSASLWFLLLNFKHIRHNHSTQGRLAPQLQVQSVRGCMQGGCQGHVQLTISYCCDLWKYQRIAGKIAVELYLSSNAVLQNSNHSLPHTPWIRKTLSLFSSQCSLCFKFSL